MSPSLPEPALPTIEPPAAQQVLRSLGRFRLLQLIGKSQRTMAWQVHDPRHAQELVLVLPRNQPAGAEATARWEQAVRRASRLRHPHLAAVVDIGVCEHWPYVLYDPSGAAPLSVRLQTHPLAGNEAAALMVKVLDGLAFAHEGGAAHHDLQPYLILVGEPGSVRLMGLEVAMQHGLDTPNGSGILTAADALSLNEQRHAARLDVLAVGMVLHQALCGVAPLDDADIGQTIRQLPPLGREMVRLPWNTPKPVADALRAIANRATDRQPRQRYASARSLLRALDGWIKSDSINGGEPLALLIDRLHSVGSLPASPGSAERAARLALMERHRTNELAEVVLQDLALSFEMLRGVNSAQVRGAQASGNGPVLTIRRAIAMLGLDGVRRAALGLRAWPGPLDEVSARDLQRMFDQVKRAGRVAQALRPAGYDAEVVLLVALLQNLGRLITSYHFPDELQQIRWLMQSAPSSRPGEPDEPGMHEQTACYAVLGTDVEAIGAAVARHWGLDDSVLHLIRRLPTSTPPRAMDNDDDVLRAVASCANEAVDALGLPAQQQSLAVARVAQRYGRALKFSLSDLQAILDMPKSGQRLARKTAAMQVHAGDHQR